MPGREGDDRPPHLRGQINIWDQRYMMQTWGRQSAGLEKEEEPRASLDGWRREPPKVELRPGHQPRRQQRARSADGMARGGMGGAPGRTSPFGDKPDSPTDEAKIDWAIPSTQNRHARDGYGHLPYRPKMEWAQTLRHRHSSDPQFLPVQLPGFGATTPTGTRCNTAPGSTRQQWVVAVGGKGIGARPDRRSLSALHDYKHLTTPDHYLGYYDDKPSYVLPDDGYLGVSSPATLSRRTDYILRNKLSRSTQRTAFEGGVGGHAGGGQPYPFKGHRNYRKRT